MSFHGKYNREGERFRELRVFMIMFNVKHTGKQTVAFVEWVWKVAGKGTRIFEH